MPPRKLKDANAPKKNLTAYMIWSNDMRDKVRAAHPEAKMTDLAKIMGEQWKTISEQEKERYQQLAMAEKQRYDMENALYKQSENYAQFQAMKEQSKDIPKKEKKKTKKKDPLAPKAAIGAYMHFCKEARPVMQKRYPDASFTDLGRLLGAEWKTFGPEQKKKFEDLATRDKLRFEQEFNAYQQQLQQQLQAQQMAQPAQQQHYTHNSSMPNHHHHHHPHHAMQHQQQLPQFHHQQQQLHQQLQHQERLNHHHQMQQQNQQAMYHHPQMQHGHMDPSQVMHQNVHYAVPQQIVSHTDMGDDEDEEEEEDE